jgi:hypothetical protein
MNGREQTELEPRLRVELANTVIGAPFARDLARFLPAATDEVGGELSGRVWGTKIVTGHGDMTRGQDTVTGPGTGQGEADNRP